MSTTLEDVVKRIVVLKKQMNYILIEEFLIKKVKIIKEKITMTEPGCIKHLLFGSEPSEQAMVIKMGKVGEEMIKKIIMETDGFELLPCGVQCIDQEPVN